MRNVCIFPYYGGKFMWLNFLLPLFPAGPKHLVDVFGGGGSVILNCSLYKFRTYNDVDNRIYHFFKVLRDRPADLIRAVKLTPHSKLEWEQSMRWEDWGELDEMEQARRVFVALNQSRNGMIPKTNGRSFWGRSPSGKRGRDGYSKGGALEEVARRIANVSLENRSWQHMVKTYDHHHVVMYLDPPYLADARKSANNYEHEFSDKDHVALLDAIKKLKCKAMLSGYNNAMYNEALTGWRRVDSTAKSAGSASGDKRVESVWLNYSANQQFNAVQAQAC